jgi:hypothetical protein
MTGAGTRRYGLPRHTWARRPWTRLRLAVDNLFGSAPRPGIDLNPEGADEDRSRAPTARRVLGWGTPRNIRHVTERDRTILTRVLPGDPWADSVGVKIELTRLGERAWALYRDRGDVHCVEGSTDDAARLRARSDVTDVSWIRDARRPEKVTIFYRNGRPGLDSATLEKRLLTALLAMPARWPWEAKVDPDAKPDPNRVNVPLDRGKVLAGRALLKSRGYRIKGSSALSYVAVPPAGATEARLDADWDAYRAILHESGRAPPVLAAA